MSPRSRRHRRPARAREVAKFAAVTALCVDFLLISFSVWASQIEVRSQFVTVLGWWDLAKGLLILAGVSLVAMRTRSLLMGVFAVVVGLIVVLEEITGHAMAAQVLEFIGIDPNAPVGGATASLYGEVVVFSLLALIAALAISLAPSPNHDLSVVRRDLLALLAILFFFAVVVAYFDELWHSEPLKVVEEAGERIAVSLLFGYVVGLVAVPPLRSVSTSLR